MTNSDPELLATMMKAVQGIDDQIQRLQKARTDLLAAFPELPVAFPALMRSEAKPADENNTHFTEEDYYLSGAIRRLESGSWKNTVAELLKESGKLKRRDIQKMLPINKYTLNTLLSKYRDLFQRDNLGFWSLKNQEPDPKTEKATSDTAQDQ